MSLYKEFVEILIPTELIKIAEFHSEQRTKYIKLQFSPSQAPLTHLDSNYIGVLGELAARQYLELEIELKDSYKNNEVYFGDLDVNGLIYDVKTEAVPAEYYNLLRCGEIKPWDPYGCRVWTAKHMHHLPKYTGGLIFCAVQIPADTKILIKSFGIRTILIANQTVLIVGFVNQSVIKEKSLLGTLQNHRLEKEENTIQIILFFIIQKSHP